MKTRRQRAKGQALVEFALTIPVMLAIILSVLDIMPAISTRGMVMDVAETASERAARFIPPTNGDALSDRDLLCGQLLDLVRTQLSASLGAAAVTGGGRTCTGLSASGKLDPTAGNNPVVYVMPIDANGVAQPGVRLLPPTAADGTKQAVPIKVCVAYTYRPTGGLEYFFVNGPTPLGKGIWESFTYRYCGDTAINPNRAR